MADRDIVIQPGFGQNIPVKLRYSKRIKKKLSAHFKEVSYVLEPFRQYYDLTIGILGNLLNALITRDTSYLPFTNFEYTLIRIRKGEILGTARLY
jgi:uncharacterized protein YejL (UPF0352 family)